jgi:hypothetical protein
MEIIIRFGMILLGILLAVCLVLLALSSVIKWVITGKRISDKYMDWILDNMEKLEEKP